SLLIGTLPWSLLLIPLLPFLAWRGMDIARRRPQALGCFLLALAWPVVFFSASGCKRAVYILPALPPLALVLGCYLRMKLGEYTFTWGALTNAASWVERDRLAFCAIVVTVMLGIGGTVAAIATEIWPPGLGWSMVVVLLLAAMFLVRLGARRP